jgi:hypothetical protein
MSIRRLASTAAAMTAIAVLLTALSPPSTALGEALAAPQRLADAAGPESVVVAWAALLAWLAWGWGVAGLALTAASALPGALGSVARLLLGVLLPAGARRGTALLLGVGLGVGLGAPGMALAAPTAAPVAVDVPAPDWPAAAERPATTPTATAPDWPVATPSGPLPEAPDRGTPSPGEHVVVRGDCLWDIAAARLLDAGGRPAGDGEIAAAVHAWWRTNAAAIGPDPDRLLPGQVLSPPASP